MTALTPALQALAEAGVGVDLTVRRPTLDDVFLRAHRPTHRTSDDTEAGEEVPA